MTPPDQIKNAPKQVREAFERLSPMRKKLVLLLPYAKNIESAMLEAGYAPASARKRTKETVVTPDMQVVMNYIVSAAITNSQDSVERLLEELCRVGLSDIRLIFDENNCLRPMNDWPEDIARAVSGVEVLEVYEGRGKDRVFVGYTKKLKLWNKVEGLAQIAKIKGYMQPEKHEHTHRVAGLADLLHEIDGAGTGIGAAHAGRG